MTWAEIVVEIKKLTNYTARTGRSEVDIGLLAVVNALYEYAVAQMGAVDDTAVIDPTADDAGLIALMKGLLTQFQGAGSGYAPVSLATRLSSAFDTLDVSKMSKGGITVAHSAIVATTTSAEIDCRGFNTISMECAASSLSSGNWVVSILGCAISGGTFGACYEPKVTDAGAFIHVAQATPAISSNGNTTYYFRGIPNFVKILATRTTDGTLTCNVTPMNL